MPIIPAEHRRVAGTLVTSQSIMHPRTAWYINRDRTSVTVIELRGAFQGVGARLALSPDYGIFDARNPLYREITACPVRVLKQVRPRNRA